MKHWRMDRHVIKSEIEGEGLKLQHVSPHQQEAAIDTLL